VNPLDSFKEKLIHIKRNKMRNTTPSKTINLRSKILEFFTLFSFGTAATIFAMALAVEIMLKFRGVTPLHPETEALLHNNFLEILIVYGLVVAFFAFLLIRDNFRTSKNKCP